VKGKREKRTPRDGVRRMGKREERGKEWERKGTIGGEEEKE
jgi:hypothetical protein